MPLVGVNVPDDYFCMAGFEVIMYGRFWVITEDYKSHDIWVLGDAQDYIASTEGLGLSDHSGCFEYGDYTLHYEFINSKGIAKLKEEWPDIWKKYELDKYT